MVFNGKVRRQRLREGDWGGAKKHKMTQKCTKSRWMSPCGPARVTGLALMQLCAGINAVFTSRCQYNVLLLSPHEWRNWL